MDKKTLNNEIVLCRAAVRKAKVAVIRKIVKKMRILKSCKVEALKEKKQRKAERLFKKVQIMKKVKVDEVTKFALRNSDLEPFLKGPKVNLQQKALACLAQHDAVMKKVNSIRERIPNWETQLSLMLDTLGRKNKKKLSNKKDSIKNTSSNVQSDEKVAKKGEIKKNREKVNNVELPHREGTAKSKKGKGKFKTDDDSEDDCAKSEVSDSSMLENSSNSCERVEVEKVEDPFFIGKKVIAPKLAPQNLPSETNEEKIGKSRKHSLKKEIGNSLFHTKPYKSKKEFSRGKFMPQVPVKMPEEDNIHPSWAAKKVKLIKPFQGKKITFSDD